MPNIKSAKKRVKVTETKTLNNRTFKTALKTSIKKFEAAIAAGEKAAAEAAYKDAVKKVDKAAAKGLIHKSVAARKKSQFTLKLNAMA
jgi:small subunit ribosomal protein S20